jgi:hypothetical protein
MSARAAAWLAWSLWVLGLAFAAAILALVRANYPAEFRDQPFYLVGFLAFLTVGALVASRRPENPIGWIFCAVALSNFLWAFGWQYAVYALVTEPGSLPGGRAMAWLGTGWSATLGWGLMATFVPLLFPTGRLPSRRWRPVAWLAAALLALGMLALAFTPGPISEEGPAVPNPAGMDGFGGALVLVENIAISSLMAIMVASVSSVVLRYRRSRGEERQQIKWFAFAIVLLVTSIVLGILANFVPGFGTVSNTLQVLGVSSVPAAVGIAILRYRLYDIDRIINHTLVYGALTAALVLVYIGGVVLLQSVFRALTGQESQLAIVASTLAIAALFNPLRRRIQSFIDRRFYRRKYDAARTLDSFGARLRDEVGLDALSADLLGVVGETVQPEHASLWLRPPDRAGRGVQERNR